MGKFEQQQTTVSQSAKDMESKQCKKLGEIYVVPDLPGPLQQAIIDQQTSKFSKHCSFRQVMADTVFYDLTNTFTLWYPSSKQYECIARGIINCLRIEVNDKEMNSWRETMKARFKRERKQVADINEEVKIHKEKYSRLASGRPVKKQELTLLSERDPEKKIVLQINQDEKDEELEEVTLKMKQEIEKERPDLQMVLA
ncbi:unnamed protein product, partial [Didymodactylos carnosus]